MATSLPAGGNPKVPAKTKRDAPVAPITPAALRAGRAILKWSTRELARQSGLAFTTVNQAEQGRAMRSGTATKIRQAFEKHGVTLISDSRSEGALSRVSLGDDLDVEAAASELVTLATSLLRVARKNDRRRGLGHAQLSAVSALVRSGSTSINRLARMERVTPSTMGRIVNALAEEGLISKDADTRDRRIQLLTVTHAGQLVYRAALQRRVAMTAALLALLQTATVHDLLYNLRQLDTKITGSQRSD